MQSFSVFDTTVLKAFFRITPTKEAMLYLSLTVEGGKEIFVQACREESLKNPEEQAQVEIWKLLALVNEEDLFTDETMAMSLRIAMGHDAAKADKEKCGASELFLKRLYDIFPQKLAERIYIYARDKLNEDKASGAELFPTKEQLNRHFEESRKILGLGQKKFLPHQKPIRGVGIETKLVPCPNCEEKKRCDPNTKRFRCQKCGLDRQYPFSAQ